ncbi:hypothetical protein ASG12_07575 [Williamsia sp. Leaf354]|uniref:CD225/dispanin family protein n=1 Tax=Williamsia sp. Leaf354 TaxID=1736349 RepID=UPI000701C28B|nr:CD225/dispanin family protein [Williamsia sp. Leaf354]KQS00713.1 hypothetical protein ASG12_07575 [Williamsia sp. Leaf354]
MTQPSAYRPDQYNAGRTDNRYGAGPQPTSTPTTSAPSTNGGWAAATVIFFWPLAFAAFSRALSIPMLWSQGRHAEAHEASATVARLGKIAVIVGIVLMILVGVLYAVALSSIDDAANSVRPFSDYSSLSSPYSSGGN